MQEVILAKIILYAPVGIVFMLLILIPILAANLHQIKKIRKGMEDTLEKAQAYFNCILEEEKPKENDLVEEAEQKLEKTAEKVEDAALLQDVLLEYFS